MPATTIEVRRKYTTEDEVGIIDAVHAALVEALRIPESANTIRLIAHEPHRFTVDPLKDERFTLISIDLFSGRSLQAKRRLYAAIVKNLAKFNIPADGITVILREGPRENWGIRGVPASEIELPFKVEV